MRIERRIEALEETFPRPDASGHCVQIFDDLGGVDSLRGPVCGRRPTLDECAACELVSPRRRFISVEHASEHIIPREISEDAGRCNLIVLRDRSGRLLSHSRCPRGLELSDDLRECEAPECLRRPRTRRPVTVLEPIPADLDRFKEITPGGRA